MGDYLSSYITFQYAPPPAHFEPGDFIDRLLVVLGWFALGSGLAGFGLPYSINIMRIPMEQDW